MGLYANYMMIDNKTLTEMKTADNDELLDKIEDLEENDCDIYDMDKLWDGLHFLLTGVSASSPVEGSLLSEAVVGTRTFIDSEDADFVSYIEFSGLSPIISAMNSIRFDELENAFDPIKFRQADIYPNIWQSESKDELFEALKYSFEGLKSFYERAEKARMNIVVSIF